MVATPECSRRSLSLCHCHVHISSVYLEILDHQGRLVTLLEQSNYTLTITIEIDSGIEKNHQKFNQSSPLDLSVLTTGKTFCGYHQTTEIA